MDKFEIEVEVLGWMTVWIEPSATAKEERAEQVMRAVREALAVTTLEVDRVTVI